MLSTPIPAYLYQQYADDDDLQAFVQAFNAAAQYYLDWFNDNPLGYYPGLSASLLDWVAHGVYGMQRTALASPLTPAAGPLNTETANGAPLNSFTPPAQSYYNLSDDAFKRILTWNFYKGDGKRFSMRWLKRRIMRFLLGTNGTDPQPGQPGFVVGCEDTRAVSVTVASNTLTVSIDQALLSSIVQIAPGILQILQLAFEAGQAGPLELPLQYDTYQFDIVTNLTASASPAILSVGGAGTSQSTPTTYVTVLGGSGAYTYSWAWQAGTGAGISIASPSAASTDFTATGMTPGDTYTGVAVCTVTDTISLSTTTCSVSVSIDCYAALSASCSPTSVAVTAASSSETTPSASVTITGGSGHYSVSWGWQSGGSGILINSATSATTSWTSNGLAAGQTNSGVALCTVTDTVTGLQTTTTCSVSISRVTAVTASISPSSVSSSGTATSQTTGSLTVSASGGSGLYSYDWAWISGGAGLAITAPNAPATTFQGNGMTPGNTYSGTVQCTITDAYNQQTTVQGTVSITCQLPAGGTYSGSVTSGYNSGSTALGYQQGSIGAVSPTTDSNGRTIQDLYYIYDTGSGDYYNVLSIAGFSSDPGQTYFSTLTIQGTGYSSSSMSYSYSAGVATWQLVSPTTVFNLPADGSAGSWSFS